MTESVAERFRRSEIAELLARYPGLRLVPSGSMALRVEGTLRFCANGKKTEVIEDGYDVRIEAPEKFPERMALAWETGGRIPPDYHKLTNGALCLGSRVRLAAADGRVAVASALRRALRDPVPLRLFVFGEARRAALRRTWRTASSARSRTWPVCSASRTWLLPSAIACWPRTKRRRANKQPCPCGSGRRLGRCHNRRVNALRKRVGRAVLASEMRTIALAFREQSRGKRIADRARGRRHD